MIYVKKMEKLKQKFSICLIQIKALLKKDFLVRVRQPWMLVVQFLWPFVIFLALYALRNRFIPKIIPECQYPTRLLPAQNNILHFFHSYICTIENSCKNSSHYEEVTNFENAPLKPILNIAQTILNEDLIFKNIINLPESADFEGLVFSVATHPKFSYIESNFKKLFQSIPNVEQMLGSFFDITKLFSDDKTFSLAGKLICGKPFPHSNNIRLVKNILYSKDFNEANNEELKAMPTKYCKQLYLDVTNTNNGKITWSQIKPIIQGKIIFGPQTENITDAIKYANITFVELEKLQKLANAFDSVMTNLREDKDYLNSYMKLVELARSPLIQAALGNSFDIKAVEDVLMTIATDTTLAIVFRTVYNILECFSVDRFVPVQTESELEKKALDLNKRKLFYAGVYFNETLDKEISYKIRMEIDNTPVTIENRNRFWYPGPEASFDSNLRYHRGFIQIKHALDLGIIKMKKHKFRQANEQLSQNPITSTRSSFYWEDDNETSDYFDDFFVTSDSDLDKSSPFPNEFSSSTTMPTLPPLTNTLNLTKSSIKSSTESFDKQNVVASENIEENTESILVTVENFTEKINTSLEYTHDPEILGISRKKRETELPNLFGLLFGNKNVKEEDFLVDKLHIYTKQFPYPKYTKDDFKIGLYLAQSVQMAFFIALIVQIATCVRYRIWMKESRNSMIMRSMGMSAFAEISAWCLTTFIEIFVTFAICCAILYSGGILLHTSFIFIFIFLLMFGVSVISFCYMCSSFFSSASIGCVAVTILFLMSFLPYIVIICLGVSIHGITRLLTNLSVSTAFCYAWNYIMRLEVQEIGITFETAINSDTENDFVFAAFMIIFDTILYAFIGYFVEKFMNGDFKFYTVERSAMDPSIGAIMEGVSKIYPGEKVAVSNISLSFRKDHITCLLGRNGAGKSTILQMITGQTKPTSGRIVLSHTSVMGKTFEKVGLCSQENVLIPNLTTREHLELYARIKLGSGFEFEVSKTVASLNFGKYENFEAAKLSGGYQRRLCVAIAFIGSPNLVVLDEPCNGVDIKARKCVWELVKILKKDRAVLLATHYLDEAEYLSDSIVVMNEGTVLTEYSAQNLRKLLTNSLELNVVVRKENIEYIQKISEKFTKNIKIESNSQQITMEMAFQDTEENDNKVVKLVEEFENNNEIQEITVNSKGLDSIFTSMDTPQEAFRLHNGNDDEKINITDKEIFKSNENLSLYYTIQCLLWKRFLHFKRNPKLVYCILVLPVIFEIIAMSFMQLRPADEYDKSLELNKDLYLLTQEFISLQHERNFTQELNENLMSDCNGNCARFNQSEQAYRWLLNTHAEYISKRYGGLSFNESIALVWYNNKGYHSMPAWLNDLNSHILKREMNDNDYEIRTYNHPLKLGERELSTSSILQQVSDAGISLILVISFSLVAASASVYIVTERINGEKLQLKLCGVNFGAYWTISLFWDLIIYLIAVSVCIIVLLIFNIPVFVAKSNLYGISLILVLYGFAIIPAVHLFEKMFSDPSFANMAIFCLNVIIALFTITVILLFDVLGESKNSEAWRNFFSKAFLIFPQYALCDGLIEICKNYIVAAMFLRYDINTYKSPIGGDLLYKHIISLLTMGVIFMLVNFLVECRILSYVFQYFTKRRADNYELRVVSIQTTLKENDKYSYSGKNDALTVENLCKCYKRKNFAIKDINFNVKFGECFGLLGNNGAGKSTIFGILSGQIEKASGYIKYNEKYISYCPQTCFLDALLTVEEVIKFYGKLRKANDIKSLTSYTLRFFHLEDYKNVLVKNLSGGNKRKLSVAVACFGNPNVILLDEPTSDMDPVTRSLLYKAIKKLKTEQRAVVLTSHSISEIEDICDSITVLKDGKQLTSGSLSMLKEKYGVYYSVILFSNDLELLNKKEIFEAEFPQAIFQQEQYQSLKFLIKVKLRHIKMQSKTLDKSLTLSEMLCKLAKFSRQNNLQCRISKCKLEKIFEDVISSEDGLDLRHSTSAPSETIT